MKFVRQLDIILQAKKIATIKNTMSDRHSMEKKLNTLLKEYRTSVLSEIVANWENLSYEEQAGMAKLNYLFCGLHFMVAMAECANEAILESEKLIQSQGERFGAQKVAPGFCSIN